MGTSTEDQKKAILPFLQRADEISKLEPKVAYYCRLYAVEQGLQLSNRTKEIDGVLGALMAKLEKDKPGVKLGDADQQYCENFALTVFTRADKVDRAGRADKNTATTFYAASIFVEILRQFGELQPDLVEMQRYAAWKAADIRKALRENRTPLAGPPGGDFLAGADASQSAGPPDAGNGSLEGGQLPVRGTVAKLEVSPTDGQVHHLVALSDRIITASSVDLALEYEVGERVTYFSADGQAIGAQITHVDGTHWRPSYLVQCDDGSQRDTTDDRLVRASALAATTSPGPAPPIPPPAPRAPAQLPDHPSQRAPPPPSPQFAGNMNPLHTGPFPPAGAQLGFTPSLAAVTEAQKCAKYAASSLGFEDISTAVKFLSDALRLLTQPSGVDNQK
ncbi:hypothetical protein WJX72_004252 [[Myrmecia] bisecta]|uniref:Vacuolar protein sorting-associated protein VTA1 n=1 Tax=[Myrmecia] bisecta TaxID=41462 RepID=A0AAW1QAC6_9CHLO